MAVSLDKKSNFIFTDEELISRFQNGDERAYVELVNRYKDRLLNFVSKGRIQPSCTVVEFVRHLTTSSATEIFHGCL